MHGRGQLVQYALVLIAAIIIGHYLVALIQELFPYAVLFVVFALITGRFWKKKRHY